jgi:hypothetical protein
LFLPVFVSSRQSEFGISSDFALSLARVASREMYSGVAGTPGGVISIFEAEARGSVGLFGVRARDAPYGTASF